MNVKELTQYFGGVFATFYLLWYLLNPCIFTQICIITGLSFISWTFAYFIYECRNTEPISPHNKAVLVTGCDTGFGHDLVQRLDRFGFTVFAGVLFPEGNGAKTLKEKCTRNLRIVKLDVTKQEDVENAAKELKNSKIPLWSIVNNAGIGVGCPFDWGNDVDELKKQFEVNVFGMARVTKNCMPMLRQTQGRVVNVTSVAGRIAAPKMSHYCMSKHASRVFSDVVRREMAEHNVSVVVIEPIFYKTPIVDIEQMERSRNRIFEQTPVEIKALYNNEERAKISRQMKARIDASVRTNVSEVVDAMEAAVTLKNPKLYYRCCGYLDIITIWAFSHMPEVLLDWVFQYKEKSI